MPAKRTRLMYIEQKTEGRRNLDHFGPAEGGQVSFSKTGRTVYYRGKTFQRIKGGGLLGNYRCLEDGNEYWISGLKKRSGNRHWSGGGPVIDNTGDAASGA